MPQAVVGLIALAGVPGLVTGGTVLAPTLTALGSVVAGGIGLGFSIGTALLLQPNAPKPNKTQSVVRQNVPPRWRHYGTAVLVGGAMMFQEVKDGDLYMIINVNEGEIDGIEEVYFDNRLIEYDGLGVVTTDPYNNNDVNFYFRLGTADQDAYEQILAEFPSVWTEDHKGNGIAHVQAKFGGVSANHVAKRFPNRIPVIQTVIRATKVFDPRDASTAVSANLALIARDYLTAADGVQIPEAYIDDDDFAAAAEDCDVLLPNKAGGTTRRYWGSLSYSFDMEPASIVKRLSMACDGKLRLKPDGKVGFRVGVWQAPTVTIPYGHIITVDLADGSGPLQSANEIIVKYTEVQARFAEAVAQPWRDEDDIDTYGDTRTATLEAYEIGNHNHARRIAKIVHARANPRWVGTVVTDLYGLLVLDEPFFCLDIPDLDIDGTVSFELSDWTFDTGSMQYTLSVVAFDDPYAFDPAAEEGTAPALPDAVDEDAIPTPEDVEAVGQSIVISAGVRVAQIHVTWAAPGRNDVDAQVQYSIADEDNWQAAGVTPGALSVDITGLIDGSLYDVRVRWVGASGSFGNWFLVENIAAIADPDAPDDVLAVTCAAAVTPLGAIDMSWTSPNSANYRSAHIYRSTVNNSAAAPKVDTIYGPPSTPQTAQSAVLAAGTYYVWIAAANGSGVEGTRVAAGGSPVTIV